MIKLIPASRKVVTRIKNIKRLTQAGIEHASYTSGVDLIKATSKEILKKPKHGQTYIRIDRAGRRRRHIASASDETHANMTGALRRTLSFKVRRNQIEFGFGVDKSNAPDYAEAIEWGKHNRQSAFRGIKSQRRNIENSFKREIGKRLGDKVI